MEEATGAFLVIVLTDNFAEVFFGLSQRPADGGMRRIRHYQAGDAISISVVLFENKLVTVRKTFNANNLSLKTVEDEPHVVARKPSLPIRIPHRGDSIQMFTRICHTFPQFNDNAHSS